jgi:hypothetical protein
VSGSRTALLGILTAVVLVLTALGFFVRADALLGIQWILVTWAVIIAAFAGILGFFNVIAVHITRLSNRDTGWGYSLVLVISAVCVLIIGVGELVFHPEKGIWGPLMDPVFVWVIAPLEAAAAALLPFLLTYAVFRMLRMDRRKGTLVFLVSAMIILVSRIPLRGLGLALQDLREFWLSWLAVPGLRAVLIGVALGISMTALRLIMGIDRPQN